MSDIDRDERIRMSWERDAAISAAFRQPERKRMGTRKRTLTIAGGALVALVVVGAIAAGLKTVEGTPEQVSSSDDAPTSTIVPRPPVAVLPPPPAPPSSRAVAAPVERTQSDDSEWNEPQQAPEPRRQVAPPPGPPPLKLPSLAELGISLPPLPPPPPPGTFPGITFPR